MNPEQKPKEDTAQNAQWSYTSGELMQSGEQTQPTQEPVPQGAANEPILSWTASEFIEHDKSTGWYLTLGIGSVVVSILVYLITKQIMSIVLVILMAIVFAIYGSAKPRTLSYTVSSSGLTVGNAFHPFNTIKSFSVINEEGMPYIQVLFQKRLSVPVTIYAAPEEIDTITEVIGKFVPYDQKKRDIADKLSSRIRF
jgi:hypothetical protein